MFLVALVAGLLAAVPAAADTGPTCAGRRATIVGTGGNDRLIGTAGSDVIVGFGGEDIINGQGGDDFICGNGGRDYVHGGEGHDRIWGGPGDEWALLGDGGNDYVDGGSGNDIMSSGRPDGSGSGQDVLLGRGGNDSLDGGSGADRIYGGGGADVIEPGRGKDHVHGGPGIDRLALHGLHGGVQADLAKGELLTLDGRTTLVAVEDVWGTGYPDVLKGDAGRNWLVGAGSSGVPLGDLVEGRGGNDLLEGHEAVGGPGDDRLYHVTDDASGPTSAKGGPGDDRFRVTDRCRPGRTCSAADVRFAGGDGRDRIQVFVWPFGGNEPSYRFDLRAGLVTSNTGLRAHVRDTEEVVGTAHEDTIIGTDGPEYLIGSRGDDTIQGWGGNDTLTGGTRAFDDGTDTLQGGRGSGDVCYTSSPPRGAGPADTIAGCEITRGVPAAR